MKTFASDNYSGVHPAIMDALQQANAQHAGSYGSDDLTLKATETFKNLFGENTEIFFVYNGTGANVLGLRLITDSFHSIFCSDVAHIHVDESTAPEKFLGCKIIPIANINGKISPASIEERIKRTGDQHYAQAGAISISQPTEYGTLYTLAEIKTLSDLAKKYGLYLHMDGARISNAAASLNLAFRSFTKDAGVDVLSFGGTKNGMMFGEAVLVFEPSLAPNFKYYRKQACQLHSKMRFISAQFLALFHDDLWRKNAVHANHMARLLAHELNKFTEIRITQPVEANGIFAILPLDIINKVQEEIFFYLWDEQKNEVRFMCSFDTTEEDIADLINAIKKYI